MWRLTNVILVTLMLCSFGTANAALITQTNGSETTVLDTATGLHYYWDLSDFDNQTYDEQLNSISDLNNGSGYYGNTNWHMASLQEMESLWQYSISEISSSFNPCDEDPRVGHYTLPWQGRYESIAGPGEHYYAAVEENNDHNWFKIALEDRSITDDTAYWHTSAWTVSSVPIPSAVWLLFSGLVGLVGFRQKFRKE